MKETFFLTKRFIEYNLYNVHKKAKRVKIPSFQHSLYLADLTSGYFPWQLLHWPGLTIFGSPDQ